MKTLLPFTTAGLLAITVAATTAAPLRAQLLTVSVSAATALHVTTIEAPAAPVHAFVPAGTTINSGFSIGQQTALVAATSHVNYDLFPWMFEATLSGSCFVGANAAKGSAAMLGRQSILVELHAAQPMKIRARLAAQVYSAAPAPAGRAEIDLGNDGAIDFKMHVPDGTFAGHEDFVDLELPAGTTPVLLTIELDVEPDSAGISLQTGLFTSIHIEPAHAEFANEGTPCGWGMGHATLHALQLLDGESVAFSIVGSTSSDLHFLVFGLQRTALPLPLAPNCPLLVTPDIVFTGPSQPLPDLPLGALGPGEVFAQGLVLRPVGFPFWSEGLFSTQRLAIAIH